MNSTRAIAAAAVAGVMLTGVAAQAASGPSIPVGFYGPTVAATKAGTSATVNLNVIDHGKKVDNMGLQCATPATSPPQGLPPSSQIVVEETAPVPIKNRKFSFAGTVTLGPEETGNGSTVTGSFSIMGKFKSTKAVLGKAPTVSGTAMSTTFCDPATLTAYTVHWAQKMPAPAATTRR
jgi:hypothetical protein